MYGAIDWCDLTKTCLLTKERSVAWESLIVKQNMSAYLYVRTVGFYVSWCRIYFTILNSSLSKTRSYILFLHAYLHFSEI